MEISKSTPYVRYRENISSTLHKGTIHIESEYLDRERKTTIESIEGQTWQNMVNGENKEEDILPRLGMKIEGNEDIFDSVEQHMPIDTIIGDIEPVANEDGTYTYEISTMEGSYAKTLDGENNFSLTSDGLIGDMYIKYNAQGEEVNGNIVMNNWQSSYIIENSNTGEITSAILKGQTLVNIMKKIDKMDVHQARNDDDTYIEGNYFVFDLNKTDVDVAQNRYMQKDNPTTYPLEQGKTYTLLINIEENISSLSSHTFVSVIVKFSDGSSRALNIKGDGSVGIQKFKFQAVLSEITTLFVYYYPNSEVCSGKIRMSKDIMLLEGDYTSVDIPYFEGMQSVQMPVLTTSNYKNLANNTTVEYGYISDGITSIQKKWLISDFISIEPNVSYTTRSQGATNDGVFAIAFYDEDKTFISKRASNNEISPTNAKFARINVRKSNGLDITEEEKNDTILYLEKTTEVLPFESHKTNTLTTPSDLELRKVGDIQDELDLETGKLTQRVGEVSFKSSDRWSLNSSSFNNVYEFRYELSIKGINNKCISNNFIQGNNGDYERLNVYNTSNGNITYLYLCINKSKLLSNTLESLNNYLIANPLTVQYQLETPIITQVDLTIKDQDDKIIQTLHTHPSTTHINLSSDGLIPNAEMNYTMYGNIGETTGEKITDGTDSKLIEGKIYGDTLLNVLPSPSLKNSVDYNVSMQKLNEGYDNINVADGEFKKATLYGQTLVNLIDFESRGTSSNVVKNGDTFSVTSTNTNPWFLTSLNINSVKNNGKYILIWDSFNYTSTNTENEQSQLFGIYYGVNNSLGALESGQTNNYIIFTVPSDLDLNQYPIKIRIHATTITGNQGATTTIKGMKVLEYQEGMENWDIPFFENTGSIQYPSLTTCGVNVFFEDNTMEYGAWNSEGNPISTTSEIRCKNKYTPFPKGLKNGDKMYIVLSDTSINSDTNMHVYDENKSYLQGNDRGYRITDFRDGVATVLVDDITKGSYFSFRAVSSNNSCKFALMINNAYPYEPHKSTTLTVNEEISLHKVGDIQDELNLSTGEVTQRIGEVVLDGSENWGMSNPDDVSICYTSSDFIGLFADVNGSSFIFDTIPFSNDNYHAGSKEGWFVDANKKLWIRMNDDRIGGRGVNNFKTWLSQNPITVLYQASTPTTLTVSTSIVDQDGATQPKLQSYANGYINVQSQGLLPSVNYEVPTNNSYYLDLVKTNTQYTSKCSLDCNAIIDGVTYPLSANGMFTTPSTITDKLMVLDAQVDDLMFIEGDLTGRKLDYFTGLQSVENPLVAIDGKNLFDVSRHSSISYNGSLYTCQLCDTDEGSYYYLQPNTEYRIKVICDNPKEWFQVQYNGNMTNGLAENHYKFTTDNTGKTLIKFGGNSAIVQCRNIYMSKVDDFIEENFMLPSLYVHLTTNEPIALHKIGDIKDELDLVNECVVRRIGTVTFNGSENWEVHNYGYKIDTKYLNLKHNTPSDTVATNFMCDRIPTSSINDLRDRGVDAIAPTNENDTKILVYVSSVGKNNLNGFKQWLSENPITVLYELATPTTEPVCIVPQNHRQSTTSLTLQSPLQKVGNVADQLRWNPYKGHYVRYNYIQDGVANSTYTFEDLKDMNERKYVNLYNQRTYIDTDHTVQVISHGISRYCLAEQGKQYQVRWDWVEQASIDTIKVDLCGNVKETSSSDNSVVIDVEKFTHQFIQIQGLGLYGKITNLMVIETIDGEIPDVDFFSGIQCVGNTVNIDGNTKVQIDMEQTNGNLFDSTVGIYNNGNDIRFRLDMVRPNKTYTFKHGNSVVTKTMKYNQKQFNDSGQYSIKASTNGSANVHYPFELCYADMAKDGIRPRYYDKESIILPMKLCRVGNIYDNLYYDDLRGHYRIQQSIGHKYFTGGTSEVWTMETTNGYRTIKFTCTNANIDQMAYGETICNQWKHLSTINDDMEGFIIYNGNFVIRVDKDRISSASVVAFKEYLTSNPIHLFYQLKTPQMINLTEYPNRIEFNTYRDEIFTFFKGMNPTKFTLSVPKDKTYRYVIEEEGQGLANRVTVNNETISAENMVAVKEVRGQGIANIIEDVNNVVITPRPNHEGRTTSHTLNNTKPATIRVHGFEPSGDTAIGKYNVTDKAYQLKVMSSNGDNSLSDYYVLNVPYKLETYADGTKDMVYYDEAYKQWIFKGSSVKEYTVASNGTLSETIEIFRGLAPRSGMIAEFKLMFTSGTTAARMYYSLDGITYGYTQLRNMSDGNYLYVGIFNTGGAKIDIAYKTDPNAEYTNPSPLSTQVPECFMVNQITNCTFCELTLDKQYIYSEMKSPIELETYEGSTKVFMDGNATDTNIIIRNEGTAKIVNTYTDTTYTVYWKYVDGLGNLRVTLGGTTVEVDGKQEYATLKTQLNAPQELLYVGGYNLSIKDLMVVKGAKIDDLPYFEGSRQVGTLVLDEEGNKSYKITLVQGGSVLEQRDENTITFKDDNKHNVIVHKIVGVCPTKVD